MSKRDKRTPEQILADLRARAVALIATTEEGYPIIDTDEKREAFDAVIEQRKTIKGIAGGHRRNKLIKSEDFDRDFLERARTAKVGEAVKTTIEPLPKTLPAFKWATMRKDGDDA